MRKKNEILEGDIFSIKVSNNVWTIAQLCNSFKRNNSRYRQETMAFFNYKYSSEDEIIKNIDNIDLSNPVFIFTVNGHPIKNYKLKLISNKNIKYNNVPDFRNDISKSLGMYKGYSSDYEDILKSYFGVLPWDSFAYDNYMENKLIEGAEIRNDISYMKDYTIDELKEMLGEDNFRLNQIINGDNKN